jgi:hypothetical protein
MPLSDCYLHGAKSYSTLLQYGAPTAFQTASERGTGDTSDVLMSLLASMDDQQWNAVVELRRRVRQVRLFLIVSQWAPESLPLCPDSRTASARAIRFEKHFFCSTLPLSVFYCNSVLGLSFFVLAFPVLVLHWHAACYRACMEMMTIRVRSVRVLRLCHSHRSRPWLSPSLLYTSQVCPLSRTV